MGDVLFLAHRIPYPPDKGDKIRSWQVLKHIAERATVHLGAFVDDPEDAQYGDLLRSMCGDVLLQPLPRLARVTRSLRALRTGEALSVGLYYDKRMADWVREVIRRRPISAIYVFSSQMARYAAAHLGGRRSVMDFVDVDSEKWKQYADEAHGWRRVLYAREAKLLRGVEKLAARHYNTSIFVSEAEAALFRRRAGSYGHTVETVGNGVDLDYFSPAAAIEPARPGGAPSIVFTGAMDYRPNVEAALWFAERAWPLVRAGAPGASFAIVGANPVGELQKLDGQNGIAVTGRVPDVRPYFAAADAVVAPLKIARGIQNKVLEAMAMGRPVVATPAALEGIEAVPGRDLLVADGHQRFAAAVLELVRDKARGAALGAAARARMVEGYDWAAKLAPLDEKLGLPREPRVRA